MGVFNVSVIKMAYIAGINDADSSSSVFVKGVVLVVNKDVIIQRKAVVLK